MEKPSFSIHANASFECYKREGKAKVGNLSGKCSHMWDVTNSTSIAAKYSENQTSPTVDVLEQQKVPLADVWWLCGSEGGVRAC